MALSLPAPSKYDIIPARRANAYTIGTTAPAAAIRETGMIWVDTTVAASPVVSMWTGTAWVDVADLSTQSKRVVAVSDGGIQATGSNESLVIEDISILASKGIEILFACQSVTLAPSQVNRGVYMGLKLNNVTTNSVDVAAERLVSTLIAGSGSGNTFASGRIYIPRRDQPTNGSGLHGRCQSYSTDGDVSAAIGGTGATPVGTISSITFILKSVNGIDSTLMRSAVVYEIDE